MLLDAFEQIANHQPATLFVVGDGPARARYQAICRERELTSVRFEGFRTQEELPRYYGIADVFVFPTHSDPWGLVLNEAMCSGLPVICSTAAGAAEDLMRPGQNGFVYEPGDVDALKRHMLTLLSDAEMRRRMGASSQEIIKDFSPQEMAHSFGDAVLGIANESYSGV